MARKKRYRRSSAQLGFEPFIAPEGFTKPEQWKEYGLTVDIFSIFAKSNHPNKALVGEVYCNSSKDAISITPTIFETHFYGYTLGGLEYNFTTLKDISYPQGSEKRWVLVCTSDINSIWVTGNLGADYSLVAYVSLGSVGVYRIGGSYLKYAFTVGKSTRLSKGFGAFINYTLLKGKVYYYGTGIESNNNIFQGCSGISSVYMPNLIVMQGQLFIDCTKLSNVELNPNAQQILGGAFNGCTSITSIQLPENLLTLGSQAFYNCTALTSFQVPPNLVATTGLGGGVISNTNIPVANVTSLSPIYTVGESGTVGYGCIFEEVGGVKKRAISAPKTFAGLSGSLDLASYASGLTSIDTYAFYGCSGITSLTVPNSVTSIGTYAFYGCSGITSLTLPSGLTSVEDYAFSNCTNLASVDIPSSVSVIKTFAFSLCSKLENINLSEGITSIGRSAFQNSICSNITIPSTVSSVDIQAFGTNSRLNTITINAITLTLFGSAQYPVFSNCNNVTILNLPIGYNDPLHTWNFSQKLALTTTTADALAQSMINIAAGGPDTTLAAPLSGNNYICTVVSVSGFSVGMTVNIGGVPRVLQAVYPATNQLQFATTTFPSLPVGTLVSGKKVIHIGAVNKTNLLANGTPSLIATMNANLTANYKQLNASNTTLSVATTGVAIMSITVASTAGYLSSGTIMLGTTSIAYTSTTATTFVFTSRVIPAYTVGTVVSEV